ncbi:MAG: P-type conjugative transfer protein TrbJ [Acidithiobacillus sp.]|uniref:P-type conjugative transfer protein TrbJ n=1 Tax=Acidithiobacillus ferrooxidans TaxID=920 RepID=UPI001C06A511|nr:P-type conjugative transfer protein TrbJ [Acidithiobacillus ferrooxidans]MBU2772683.1 P-type conjugative transfer protein TrbJ [Acidithiobacillus ferrooxidans]
MKFKQITISVLATLVLATGSNLAIAGTLTGGATLPEQIVQEGTSIEQLARAAEQVQNQLQMLLNEARNLESLPTNFVNQITGQLGQLTNIVGQGDALSYAGQNISSQLSSEYPGYSNGVNYQQEYQNWNNTTSQNIQNALQAQNLASNQFATQSQALASIQSASQSAAGRMQVLQAGNQIAGMEVKSIQHLQQIEMAQNDARLAYEKQKLTEASQQNSLSQQELGTFLGTGGQNAMGSGSNINLGNTSQFNPE